MIRCLLLAIALNFCLGRTAVLRASDSDALQGTWEITALIDDGALVPDETLKTRYAQDARFKFDSQSISFVAPGTLQTRSLLFLIDEKASPKTIDLGGSEKTSGKGIYMLSGDTLMICIGEAGTMQRPTEFTAKKGSPQLLMTLKRLTPAAVTAKQPQPSATPPAPLKDDEVRGALVGTWGHQDEDWLTLFTLNADGTFSSTRNFKNKFGKLFNEDVRSSGTWKIQNGIVICTVAASTDKNLVNQIFSYRIQSISATELLAIDQFGRWRREWKTR